MTRVILKGLVIGIGEKGRAGEPSVELQHPALLPSFFFLFIMPISLEVLFGRQVLITQFVGCAKQNVSAMLYNVLFESTCQST